MLVSIKKAFGAIATALLKPSPSTMKKLILILVVLFSCQINFAQSGSGVIKGLVVEKANNELVPFANVVLLKGIEEVLVTTKDFDGIYTLKPISVGFYDLKVNYVGFPPQKVSEITVDSNKLTLVNVNMFKGIEI